MSSANSEFVTVGYQFSAAFKILRVSFEVWTVNMLVWISRFALNVFGGRIVIFAYFSLGRLRSSLKSWILLLCHLKLRTSLNSARAISLLHYVTESLSTNCFGNYFYRSYCSPLSLSLRSESTRTEPQWRQLTSLW